MLGRSRLVIAFVTVGVMLGRPPLLSAGTVTWIDGSGDWSTPANWSSNPSLPGASDSVVLGDPAVTITHSQGADTIRSLSLQANVLLSGGSLSISGGAFDNRRTVEVATGAALSLGLGGGTWTNANGGAMTVIGGVLSLYGTASTADLNQASFHRTGGTVVLAGTLNNGGATLVELGDLQINSGQINGGTIGAESEPRTLTFNGSSSNRLTAVTVNGILTVPHNGWVSLRDDVVLNGSATVASWGTVAFGRTDGGKAITFDADSGKSATVTLASGRLVVPDLATLTVGARAAVVGWGSIGNNSAAVVNLGTIRADGGTFAVVVKNLDNRGLLEAVSGATLQLGGTGMTWTNINGGTFRVSGGELNLAGTASTADLNPATFQRSGGTVALAGTLDNRGQTLAIGPLTLAGGAIAGGTVVGNVVCRPGTTSRLDVDVLEGDLQVISYDTTAARVGSATLRLNGTATLAVSPGLPSPYRAVLSFDALGAQTLVSGTVSLTNDLTSLAVEAGTTLTLAPGTRIAGRGGVGSASYRVSGGTSTLNNSGTISADTSGGGLGVHPGNLTNTGTLEARNGGSLSLTASSFANNGMVQALSGSTVTLGPSGAWTSASGTLRVDGGTLVLGTTFSTADLNQAAFQRTGGTVVLLGTVNNTGATLSEVGDLQVKGGHIKGGVVGTLASPRTLTFVPASVSKGSLDGVKVNGNIVIPTDIEVNIRDDLILNGSASVGSLGAAVFGRTDAAAATTFDAEEGQTATLTLAYGFLEVQIGKTLTIGSRATVGGWGMVDNSSAGAAPSLVNQGTIRPSGGNISISVSNFDNRGRLEVVEGATLSLCSRNAWTNVNGGVISVNGGTLRFFGTASTADLHQETFQRSGGTVVLLGTLNNGGMTLLEVGDLQMQGGRINGGTIGTASSPRTLTFVSSSGNYMNGVTVNGTLALSSYAHVTLSNGLVLNGTATVDKSAVLTFDRTDEATAMTLDAEAGNTAAVTLANGKVLVQGGKTLNLGGRATLGGWGSVATSGAAAAAVVNQGTVRASGGTLAVSVQDFTNDGLLGADGSGMLSLTCLKVGPSGYLVMEPGATLTVTGDLASSSGAATLWNTTAAELVFPSGGEHHLDITGDDLGALEAGYHDNFAWGTLTLGAGESLLFADGDAEPGGALYVGTLALAGGLDQINSISGNGLSVYYDPSLPGNSYLNGKTYDLTGGGQLSPIPEPATFSLLALGGLALLRRRRIGPARPWPSPFPPLGDGAAVPI